MYCVRTIFWLLAIIIISRYVFGSEHPERECCDLTTTEPTSTGSNNNEQIITSTTLRPGSNTKATVAILNCITARQLCFNDSSCSTILEIIPRVCGPEVVACSTVTVTKCQAALRTLQAFPFFKPTCLCREPHMDPECNSFRDSLFDHPCVFVKEKEKDPYPVNALPTCIQAHQACQHDPKCIKLFEDFKIHCKVRDNKCLMKNKEICFESYTALRRSPFFGCFCPNNHTKKRCDRIFSTVNHNPCIAPENVSTSSEDNIINPNLVQDSINNHHETLTDFDHSSDTLFNDKNVKNSHKDHYSYPDEEEVPEINNYHHTGPSNFIEPEKEKLVFQSTCHSAMDSCNNNYHCRMLLSPILHHCDISRCNRNSCMEALQTFYGKPESRWNVEIAFCLCKRTDNKHDACLVAQEKLHPVCAQRPEESPQPTCLNLAEMCKESKPCRSKLEYYEQSCAVDSITKKCAGSPKECRKAILAILGTNLRTSCACKGTDMNELYDCLGWQRLLWLNPCVVEAQKHYHMKKAIEQGKLLSSLHISTSSTSSSSSTSSTSTTTTTTTTLSPSSTIFTVVKSFTEAPFKVSTEFLPPPQRFAPTSTIPAPSTTTLKRTTSKRTRATTTTTMVPLKSCMVPQYPDHYIREGSFKRIFHKQEEYECSDLCECQMGEKLVCREICIDRMPCRTEFAYYNHLAPAYKADRGRCLCYSGRFVCMKPPPTDYLLPHGVFLFLGYSEADERELNKNHTHLVVIQDVVRTLQAFIKEESEKENNGTLCVLEFFNSTRENVIIVGKLSDDIDVSKLTAIEILQKEKDECAMLMELIVERINLRHPDFLTHVLLSIFKIAQLIIVPVDISAAQHPIIIPFFTLIFLLLFNILFKNYLLTIS